MTELLCDGEVVYGPKGTKGWPNFAHTIRFVGLRSEGIPDSWERLGTLAVSLPPDDTKETEQCDS